LKPTPVSQSELKPNGTGIPTRFNGFPIAATAADTELIRRTPWPVWALQPDQPAAGGEDVWGAGGDGDADGNVGGTAGNQRRLKPTPTTASAFQCTEAHNLILSVLCARHPTPASAASR